MLEAHSTNQRPSDDRPFDLIYCGREQVALRGKRCRTIPREPGLRSSGWGLQVEFEGGEVLTLRSRGVLKRAGSR